MLCAWWFRLDEDLPCPHATNGEHLLQLFFTQLPPARRAEILDTRDRGGQVSFTNREFHFGICVLCGTDLHEPSPSPCFYPRPHVSVQEWNGMTNGERHHLHDSLTAYVQLQEGAHV